MLLYIHVPFCRQKCAYCAFYSVPLERGRAGADMLGAYLACLLGELRFWGERLGAAEVETVFFGGGTPSILPGKAIEGILGQVRGTFALAPAAEITAEANPESALRDGWLFEARAAGVNRLSLGVQSFDDAALGLLGRCHSAREAEAAFATARTAGFGNISLDFMWGMPGTPGRPQSQRQWLAQLARAVELRPEHLSAYGLTLEPGSELEGICASGRAELPAESALSSMYLAGADFLESRGYMQYEISNFSRMGYACRHNLGYWEGRDYLGLGPAAASTLRGKRWTNAADLERWRRAVKAGTLGAQTEDLDTAARLKELVMLRLRMNKGLPLKEWQALSGRSFLKEFSPLVTLLQQQGLASTRNGHFRLTRSGMLVSDTILAHFFERLDSAFQS